ncbi:20522_t:CDS:2, partial [Gigaspora margarita]
MDQPKQKTIPEVDSSDIREKFLISVESAIKSRISLFTQEKNKQSSLQNLIQMNYFSENLTILLKFSWEDKETKAWRDIILMKFLNQPNLVLSKYKLNALYDTFIETDVLEPEHINLTLTLYSTHHIISAITTKFITDHKLTNEISLKELSQYAPEILELLTDDKEKRRQACNRLLNGYKFSKEQVFALIPLQRVGRYKSQAPVPERSGLEAEEVNICQVSDSTCTEKTIKEMAQRIVRDKLSERDVKAISRALVETAPDPVVALSHLSRLRRELQTLNASEKMISATLNLEITRLSNKIQKEHSEKRKNEGINFPDHFSLESVKERLDLYDVSNTPDKQTLADVMIMLCIRPAEIKNLRISNGGVTGYAKNRGQQDIPRVFRSLEKNEEWAKELLTWIQEAIVSGQLRDPGKLGSMYLSTFLKKDKFIPKPYKLLLPSSLRKLGSVFASVVHSAKNLSEANTFASEALRHSPKNHASPSDRYTI